jgi:CBS domain-containing protein
MPNRSIRMIIEQQEAVAVPGTATVADAAQLMKEKQADAVLVVDQGRLTGIFTERDALFRVVAECRDPRQARLAEVMTADPRTIHPDRPFSEALHVMQEGGFRHVPVVEDGHPVGMVSVRDALGPELEDFVFELLRQDQAQNVLA